MTAPVIANGAASIMPTPRPMSFRIAPFCTSGAFSKASARCAQSSRTASSGWRSAMSRMEATIDRSSSGVRDVQLYLRMRLSSLRRAARHSSSVILETFLVSDSNGGEEEEGSASDVLGGGPVYGGGKAFSSMIAMMMWWIDSDSRMGGFVGCFRFSLVCAHLNSQRNVGLRMLRRVPRAAGSHLGLQRRNSMTGRWQCDTPSV
ncbi:unnamed protein product, partial [Mycena citricolor]